MFIEAFEKLKFPPDEITCRVAGVLVTVKVAATVCSAVSDESFKVFCDAAPGRSVPFSRMFTRLVTGTEAPTPGDTVPVYIA